MKNISVNRILILLIIFLVLFIVAYAYVSLCDFGYTKSFLPELILSLINGLVLALVVFIAGIFIEEKHREETRQEETQSKVISLKKVLKNVFRRAKSRYNFRNQGPSFYFDDSWLNPAYDVLTKNNREWETILTEYKGIVDTEIVCELTKFIELMDLALINTEKIDSELESMLDAGLSASMGSPYSGDRIEAKKGRTFAYWVYRATWSGADLTRIVFSMPNATDQQISIEKVSGLIGEAESLVQKDNFSSLIKQYNLDKKKLITSLKKIEKLVS